MDVSALLPLLNHEHVARRGAHNTRCRGAAQNADEPMWAPRACAGSASGRHPGFPVSYGAVYAVLRKTASSRPFMSIRTRGRNQGMRRERGKWWAILGLNQWPLPC